MPTSWSTATVAIGWDEGATEKGTPGLDNSLPVFLSSFSATEQENVILITLSTQSEVNTLGFRVLRGLNPRDDFKAVSGLIKGNGNSTVTHRYQFVDPDVQPNVTYYYRLQEIDCNGNTELHGLVSACLSEQQEQPCSTPAEFQLSAGYPNPFGPGVNKPEIWFKLLIPKTSSSKIQATVWNILGQEIARLEPNTSSDEQSLFWNGFGESQMPVPAGAYFLHVRQGSRLQIRRILLLR
jgi:hypothetical protein